MPPGGGARLFRRAPALANYASATLEAKLLYLSQELGVEPADMSRVVMVSPG